MGDKGRGKDKGKARKAAKAGKPGLRPHEQRDAALKKLASGPSRGDPA